MPHVPLDGREPMLNDSGDAAPFGKFAPRGVAKAAIALARRCGRGWGPRRVAFLCRAIGLGALKGGPVDVVSLGARMRLYPQRSVSEKRLAFTPQYFDPDERALLALRLKGDFVMLDLGAGCGGYALFVAGLGGARARILAVEPLPDAFQRLTYNIVQSDYLNIKALGCAVLDIDGEATLFVDSYNEGQSSTRLVNADARLEQIRVPAKTLLTLTREEGFTHIDAIKLDIEGAEDLALDPFFAAAPRALWPRLIVMEYTLLRVEEALEQRLEALGYREVLRTQENVAYEWTEEVAPA
jgi:FkbM family methyltransferase